LLGPHQIASWAQRTLGLNPQRAISNASPSPQQRRRDRANQLAAIEHRYNTPAPDPPAQIQHHDQHRQLHS